MTRKRSLKEKIKTVTEIQERFSTTSAFVKTLEGIKKEYQQALEKENRRLIRQTKKSLTVKSKKK